MPAPPIEQRYTAVGIEDIEAKLHSLGVNGPNDLKKLEQGAQGSQEQMTLLDAVSTKIAAGVNTLRTNLAPLGDSFANLGTAIKGVYETGAQFASRFGLELGAGVAVAVTSLGEFIKSSAEAAHQLGLLDQEFGVSPELFQKMQKAAADAGVSLDGFQRQFTRLAQTVQKEGTAQQDALTKLAQTIVGKTQQTGVDIVGVAKTVQGELISISTVNADLLNKVAQHLQVTFENVGVHKSLQQIKNEIQGLVTAAGPAGEAARDLIRAFGPIPGGTIFEQLDAKQKDFAKGLSALNIDFLDSKNQLKTLDEVLPDVARGFENIAGATEKAALARQIFGRGGAEMIPILHELATGATEASKGFAALTITDAQIKNSEAFVGQLNLLELLSKKVRDAFAQPLIPVFTPLLDTINQKILQNGESIKKWGEAIAKDLEPYVLDLIHLIDGDLAASPTILRLREDIISLGKEIGAVVSGALTIIGLLYTGLDTIVTAVAHISQAVLGIGGDFDAFQLIALLALGKVTGGIKLMTAALGVAKEALALLGVSFGAIKTDGILAVASRLGIIATIIGLIVYNIQNWDTQSKGIQALFEGLGTLLTAVFGVIRDKILEVATATSDKFNAVVSVITGFFQGAYDLIKTLFMNIVNAWDAVTSAIGKGIDWVGQKLDAIWQAAKKVASAIAGIFGGGSTTSDEPIPGQVFATGGPVPGSGRGDIVPARLEPGEYVIKRDRVQELGVGFFDRLNAGVGAIARFATGGLVSPLHFAAGGVVPSVAAGVSGGPDVHIHVGGKSFGPFVARREVVNAIAAEATSQGIRRAVPRPGWQR